MNKEIAVITEFQHQMNQYLTQLPLSQDTPIAQYQALGKMPGAKAREESFLDSTSISTLIHDLHAASVALPESEAEEILARAFQLKAHELEAELVKGIEDMRHRGSSFPGDQNYIARDAVAVRRLVDYYAGVAGRIRNHEPADTTYGGSWSAS